MTPGRQGVNLASWRLDVASRCRSTHQPTSTKSHPNTMPNMPIAFMSVGGCANRVLAYDPTSTTISAQKPQRPMPSFARVVCM